MRSFLFGIVLLAFGGILIFKGIDNSSEVTAIESNLDMFTSSKSQQYVEAKIRKEIEDGQLPKYFNSDKVERRRIELELEVQSELAKERGRLTSGKSFVIFLYALGAVLLALGIYLVFKHITTDTSKTN